MNYLKKLLGYIVTMAMVLTLTGVGIGAVHAEGTTAGATNYKITLTGTTEGHKYEAYQIFTGDLSTKKLQIIQILQTIQILKTRKYCQTLNGVMV